MKMVPTPRHGGKSSAQGQKQGVRSLQGVDLLACFLLGAILILAGSCQNLWGAVGYLHDDAIYLTTGRALARGEGYRLAMLPGAPAQTKYPILYPALLALLWRVFPEFPANVPIFKAVSLLLSSVSLAGIYLYLVRQRYCSRQVAFLSGLLTGTGWLFVHYAVSVMSEALFGVLVLLAWWRVETSCVGSRNKVGQELATGVLLALPFLCRVAGIALVPAGIYALYRAGQRIGWTMLGSVVTMLPWMVWSLSGALSWQREPVLGYYTDYAGWWLGFALADPWRVTVSNLNSLIQATGSMSVEGVFLLPQGKLGGVGRLTALVLGIVAWSNLVKQLPSGRVLPVGMVSYLGVILVWPWDPGRFLLPVLAPLTMYLLLAVESWSGAWHRWTLLLVGILALVGNTGELMRQSQRNREARFLWEMRHEVFCWVREQTREDEIVASGSDAMLALFTERKAYYPLVYSPLTNFYGVSESADPGNLESTLAPLRTYRPRWLVLMPGCHGEAELRSWIERLQKAYPEQVREVWRGTDQRFVIVEVRYPLEKSNGDG